MPTTAQTILRAKAHCAAGELLEALTLLRELLHAEPEQIEANYLAGTLCHALGQGDPAMAYLRQATALAPNLADAQQHLGVVLVEAGRFDEAIQCFERALQLRPGAAELVANIRITEAARQEQRGNQLLELGQLTEAEACFRRAADLHPGFAEAHNGLAAVLERQDRHREAVECCRRAIELAPHLAEAHYNLGAILDFFGRLDEAAASLLRALELKPDFVEAHYNLGVVRRHQGLVDEAEASFRRALEFRPSYAAAHSNILAAMQYQPRVTLAGLAAAHAEFEARHIAPFAGTLQPHANPRDPEKKLRLGFVSADFGFHPVGYFLVSVLEELARRDVTTICYSDRAKVDTMTDRLRAAASVWVETRGWDDERLAERMRADEIDIAFDLAGQVDGNRLLAFGRKPAPLAVSWIGYVGTTGLGAIDFLLADRFEVPPPAELFIREAVLRMPDGYVCYDPPRAAPSVSPLPALDRGCVTFGCFNNVLKVSPEVVSQWATILRRVPNSRLVLKYQGFNDPGVARRLVRLFATHGIGIDRLEFQGWSAHAELLREYHRIDIALDTFPYSGGLTTCEALWMGVPVVTWPGETFASRHSLSHLSNVGLTETIAATSAEYVEIAVRLAGDLPHLAEIRGGLRGQMAASPLCDSGRFVDNLLVLLRDAWRGWCAGEPVRTAPR